MGSEKNNNAAFEPNEVSKMAIQAKSDRTVITDLWMSVERMVKKVCNRYYIPEYVASRCEFDDLVQESYIQFERAIRTYDYERGCQFLSYLVLYLPAGISRAIGYGAKRRYIGESQTISIHEPINDSDDITLEDEIKDDKAEAPFRSIEDDTAVEFILEQVDKIRNDMQKYCFREYAYKQRSMSNIAEELKISRSRVEQYVYDAACSLRRNPFIKAAYPEHYRRIEIDPYTHKGLSAFKSSFSSVVEDLAMQSETQQKFLNFLYGEG